MDIWYLSNKHKPVYCKIIVKIFNSNVLDYVVLCKCPTLGSWLDSTVCIAIFGEGLTKIRCPRACIKSISIWLYLPHLMLPYFLWSVWLIILSKKCFSFESMKQRLNFKSVGIFGKLEPFDGQTQNTWSIDWKELEERQIKETNAMLCGMNREIW